MAIKTVEMDRRDSASYRKLLRRGGFLSASYLSGSMPFVAQLANPSGGITGNSRLSSLTCAAKCEAGKSALKKENDGSRSVRLYFFAILVPPSVLCTTHLGLTTL